MGFDIAAVIAAVIALVGTGVATAVNYSSTQETNNKNAQLNQTNLDFQKAQTEAAWQRDDNAYQRQVADLQKAGLSPLAASGGANTSNPLGATSPIGYQAPQLDINSILQSGLGIGDLSEKIRSNKESERLNEQRNELLSEQVNHQAKSLDIQNKQVEEQIKQNARVMNIQAEQLEELKRHNKSDEELKLYTENNKRLLNYIEKRTGGLPYKVAKSPEEEEHYNRLRLEAMNDLIKKIGKTTTSQSSSFAQNVGAGASIVGTGGNITEGTSKSSSNSEDISRKQEIMWKKFNEEYPMYLYLGDYQ